ncbi:MAG TPA: 4-alpha-glucanotransferase, partial [Candidatus Acidoferrum sp.]|nr:4-alpha-glucanotransferase [Candidatus Acidoferrum sp.]
LATTGTHDTEPLTVWWHAQPIGEREKLVRALGLEGVVNPRRMLEESARDAILAVLYAAPSRLVIIPIQDLFGWSARINRPGTITDSNWTYRIPLTLERMRRSRAIQSRVAKVREIAIKSTRFSGSLPSESLPRRTWRESEVSSFTHKLWLGYRLNYKRH